MVLNGYVIFFLTSQPIHNNFHFSTVSASKQYNTICSFFVKQLMFHQFSFRCEKQFRSKSKVGGQVNLYFYRLVWPMCISVLEFSYVGQVGVPTISSGFSKKCMRVSVTKKKGYGVRYKIGVSKSQFGLFSEHFNQEN